MASIANDPGGKRRILFVDPVDKHSRRTVYLGKISHRAAEQIKFRIEQLIASKSMGYAVDGDTLRWVAELDGMQGGLADKLARAGLITPPDRSQSIRLADFLDAYVKRRTDVKPATQVIWRHTIRNLNASFGGDRAIESISEGDAEATTSRL